MCADYLHARKTERGTVFDVNFQIKTVENNEFARRLVDFWILKSDKFMFWPKVLAFDHNHAFLAS